MDADRADATATTACLRIFPRKAAPTPTATCGNWGGGDAERPVTGCDDDRLMLGDGTTIDTTR